MLQRFVCTSNKDHVNVKGVISEGQTTQALMFANNRDFGKLFKVKQKRV